MRVPLCRNKPLDYLVCAGCLLLHAGVALGEACTIVLRGASSHILEEADRSLHDALCVLSETVSCASILTVFSLFSC